MKKFLISVFVSFFIFNSCTIQQNNYSKRTISVSGTGTVTLEADTATIILSVVTLGKEITKTSEENAIKMTAIQDALQKDGISSDCISTQNFSVYQESHYDKNSGKTVMDDYRVTNQIKILIKQIDKTSSVIDLALKNGANQLSSLTYGITNPEIAKKQAQTLAIQQAKESANLFAGANGSKLGKVLSISERPDNSYPRTMLMKNKMSSETPEAVYDSGVSTPISGTTSTVSVTIDAVYQIKD